jgi:hypothetical protein
MREITQHSVCRSSGIGGRVRAAPVEAARARICTAARQADPIGVEAATRAYGAAVNLAILANLASVVAAIPPAIRQRIRDHRARSASATDIRP